MFEVTAVEFNDALNKVKIDTNELQNLIRTTEETNMFLKTYAYEVFKYAQEKVIMQDTGKAQFNSEFAIQKNGTIPYANLMDSFRTTYGPLLANAKKIIAGKKAIHWLMLSPTFKGNSGMPTPGYALVLCGTFDDVPVYKCNLMSGNKYIGDNDIYFELDKKLEGVKLVEA